ncbi:MAG TPA: hypothetical protein VMS60_16105 [Solirubrobacterales bacterium]|nr:hypothetical protein [Solirubrobacterales bacterium]
MKFRLSPAGVIAVVALVLALGGTAIAAGVFTDKEKRQIEKIAVRAFDERIGEASVKHAAGADAAVRAETATLADTATLAKRAANASTAGFAEEATTAQRANEADSATRATEAERAVTAADAEKLGGQPATSYQRSLQGGCAPGSAIASITPQGQVTCSGNSVQSIRVAPFVGEGPRISLANGLELIINCNEIGTSEVRFLNITSENVNINFFVLRPGSTKVEGKILPPGKSHLESISPQAIGSRFEGQFTWMTSRGVTTVSLHAFQGNNFCELTGTAVTALG